MYFKEKFVKVAMSVSTQDEMRRRVEALRLMRAFDGIRDREVRQVVIEFAEQAARSCLSMGNEKASAFAKKPTLSVVKSVPKSGSPQ